MKYMLYERLLVRMAELRGQCPNGYVWGERPFEMYFVGLAFTSPVGGVDCSGSTLSAFYREWERACGADFQAQPVLAGDFYKYFVPYGSLQGQPGFAQSCVGALHRYADITIGDGGDQNIIAEPRNMRRGDIMQIWWKGLAVNAKGHSVFIHDMLVDQDGEVHFQLLSAQNPDHKDTDGIGVAGTGVKDYDLSSGLHAELYKKGTWYRYTPGTSADGCIPEMYVGRFRRPFPCWPCALPGRRDDRLPLPKALLEGAENTLHSDDVEGVAAKDYIQNAEAAGDGFYPIGLSRTWHGGIHLTPGAGRAVRAISDGVIVAARCPQDDQELKKIGTEKKLVEGSKTLPSRGFVLVRHQIKIGGAQKIFYSLYMHLSGAVEGDALFRARWLWQSRQKPAKLDGYSNTLGKRLDSGDIVLLAYPVAAGDVIGLSAEDTVHIEVFAAEDITDADYPDKKIITDSDKNLFTDSREIISKLDSQSDYMARLKLILSNPSVAYSGVVLKDEIAAVFKDGDDKMRKPLRGLVTRHISEWSTLIDWSKIKDIAAWGYYDAASVNHLKDIVALYAWLSPEISKRCLLPDDHIVHHYHPIVFIEWLSKLKNAEQLIQDVVPFLADAGERFDPITGKPQTQWEINPDYKPNGQKLELLVLFKDDGGKPSSQTVPNPDDPGKPLKQPGPWTQIGEAQVSGGNHYVQVHDQPAQWLCVQSGAAAYARATE